jgi:phosphoserine phosphatase RsbU/P
VLLTGELATNAVLHARSAFEVTITTDVMGIEVSITDQSGDDIRLKAPPIESISGRGLMIVDQLADDWGTTRTAETKTVWFRLHRPKS